MELISGEIVALLNYLVPGLVAAFVFHSLTSFVVPTTPVERVIQALIFTAVIKAIVSIVKWLCIGVGSRFSFGVWDHDVEFVWSVGFAVLLGHVFAFAANKDVYHWFWREFPFALKDTRVFKAFCRLTKRTSYPSEWYRVFYNSERCVVLHFKGENGRRLYGWPEEWPNTPEGGHFIITSPNWLDDDSQLQPLTNVERMVIPASDIEMIEFMHEAEGEIESDTGAEESSICGDGGAGQVRQESSEADKQASAATTTQATQKVEDQSGHNPKTRQQPTPIT